MQLNLRHHLVSLLIVCVVAPLPLAQAASSASPSRIKAESPLPSLAPFSSSRFWDVLRDKDTGKVDLKVIAQQIQTIYEIHASSSEAAAPYGPKPLRGEPSALMTKVPNLAERARWSATPFALEALFSLYENDEWDDSDVAQAQSAVDVLEGLSRLPNLRFVAGDTEKNRKTIRSAANWYEDQLAVPEHYASMIFIDDDGPFVGLKVKSKKQLPSLASVPLGEDLVLHLAKDKNEREPFVLQCVRGKKVLWSRRISDSPYQTVTDVSFSTKEPTKLDPLGWKVHMSVKWQAGTEYMHVYIDADGEFICYFMSW